MAASRKFVLTDDLRQRYEAGDETQASIAALHGVSRQAVHAAIKRAGWVMSPAPPAAPPPIPEPAQAPVESRAEERTTDRSASTTTALDSAGGVERVHDPYRDMRGPAHQLLVQSGLRAVQEANAGMLRNLGQNSPQTAKRVAEVVYLVTNTLGRLGFFTDPNSAAEQLTMLRIEVMSEDEEDAIRAEAERQSRNAHGGMITDTDMLDDDDADIEDMASSQRRCASSNAHTRSSVASASHRHVMNAENLDRTDSEDTHDNDDNQRALPVDVRDSASLALWLEGLARQHGRRFLSDINSSCGNGGQGDAGTLIGRLLAVAETEPARLEAALHTHRTTWERST